MFSRFVFHHDDFTPNQFKQRCLGIVAGLFVIASSSVSLAQINCAPLVPRDVCALEARIYTKTDFKKTEDVRAVMVGLKALFMAHVNDSAAVQDHLVGLTEQVLEAAFEARAPREILAAANGRSNLLGIHEQLMKHKKAHGGIVPLDWDVPSEFVYMVPSVTRSYYPAKDRTTFAFDIYAQIKPENSVEQLQIIRYPNEVILDRKAGLGEWSDGRIDKGSLATFTLGIYGLATPPKEGLYLLNIKLRNQPMTHGWFILTKMVSSATAAVHAPSPNETLRTGDPLLQFEDFTSPEFKPFVMKKRMSSIWKRNTEDDDKVWENSQVGPVSTSLKLSEAPNRTGVANLDNGAYALKVSFQERWFFGDLLLGRHTRTEVPFSVAK